MKLNNRANYLNVRLSSEVSKLGLLSSIGLLEKLFIAIIFGCAFGLSAPGFDLWFLAWIGLIPLLVLIQGSTSKLESILIGLVFGLGYNFVALSWCLELSSNSLNGSNLPFSFLLWIIESFHQALLIAAFVFVIYLLPMRAGFLPYITRPFFPYLLSIPILWVFFHWSIGTAFIFCGLPINQLAYSQCQHIELIQMAKLGGSQVVELVILLFNAACAQLIIERLGLTPPLSSRIDRISPTIGAFIDIGLITVLISIFFYWGQAEVLKLSAITKLAKTQTYANASTSSISIPVAILQGNIGIVNKQLAVINAQEISNRYLSLANNIGASMLILPEGAINPIAPNLLEQMKHLATNQRKEVLLGSIESLDNSAKSMTRLITTSKLGCNIHVKQYADPMFDTLSLGARARDDQGTFAAAKTLNTCRSVWGEIGASTGYEIIYPQLISSQVRQGVGLLVNMSNLSYVHSSIFNRQILASAIMRAVENKRYMVLSTNTGISAVIDPSGLVKSSSLPDRHGVLIDTVQFLYKKTPFTKMWWL